MKEGTLYKYLDVNGGRLMLENSNLQYTNAGIASTLMALTPIIIILPSYWLFHQKVTWRSVLGAVISVLGVSLFFLG